MTQGQDLLTGSVPKKLIRFAFPLFLANLLQALYNVVDMLVVGKIVGKTGLAAISNASMLCFIINSICIGLTMGGSVLVAQCKGANDQTGQRDTIGMLFFLSLVGSAVVAILGLAIYEALFQALNVPANAYQDGQNPDKTQGGELISSYECDYMTADAEFLLSKAKYKAATGREQRRDADVLCYQIRQSFKPGEITPEEANRVGYETAMRWTKGKYAFFVATHTDRQHIHNHIYYNSTSLDCSHKFRDFIGSARAVRRLSDRVCLENDLSVITSPKLHSKGRFLHYGAWLGTERQPSYKEQLRAGICDALAKGPDSFDAFLRLMEESGYAVKRGRGGAISFLVPGQQRATRLRSSTLGEGFDPGEIRDVIAGKRPLPKLDAPAPAAPRRVDLIVDIQERLRSGKGPAYERWAKVYNLKQMAAALQFMQEHQISEYDQLTTEAEAASARFHAVTEQLRQTEAELAYTSELMGAVVQYAKTRPVFDEYKAAKYSKRFLAQHEAELADYRAAKAALNDLLDGAKLPKMAQLKEKRRKLAAEKKALYAKYRAAQQEMRQAVVVKTNIDCLLGVTDGRKNKEQER